ncbi:KEOPS complex subunit Cgi121 [Pyrococcus horikoshii]|nr:KEOPS complex subunit Cgi121 [Pyrococcus horikoshii]HII61417.1 KEOPS complex subunit Cgi121 [Pyrococcus horikoshii]
MLEIKTKFGNICIAKVHLNEDDVGKVLEACDEQCQVMRTKCYEEVVFATILALKSFNSERNTAKTVRGEILLRLAGVKQIKDALKLVGASKGENFIVIFNVDNPCDKLRRLLQSLGIREIELNKCPQEELKKSLEKMAMVEAF